MSQRRTLQSAEAQAQRSLSRFTRLVLEGANNRQDLRVLGGSDSIILVASNYIGVEDGDVLVIVAISFVDVVDCCDLSVSEIDPGACCNVLCTVSICLFCDG